MKRRPILLAIAVVVIVADLALLISGQRVLVWQRYVPVGSPGAAEGFEGRRADAPSVECWYFTGRSVRSTSYWYSPNGVMGKDECPFLVKPDD